MTKMPIFILETHFGAKDAQITNRVGVLDYLEHA